MAQKFCEHCGEMRDANDVADCQVCGDKICVSCWWYPSTTNKGCTAFRGKASK